MADINVDFVGPEKRETIDVRKVDIQKRMGWDKKVQSYARELANQKKPFCSHCAMRAQKTWKKQQQHLRLEAIQSGRNPPIPKEFNTDLAQFEKGMKFVNESVIPDKKIVNGTPVHVPVYFHNYVCSVCDGAGKLSIESETSISAKK